MTYTFDIGYQHAGDIRVAPLRGGVTPLEVALSDSVRAFVDGDRLVQLELDDVREFASADAAVEWANARLAERATA